MKTNKTLRQLLGVVLAVCLVFALASVAMAATTNQAVLDDKSGVLHVNLVYTDAAGKQSLVQSGSGFLVNDTYLITCNHVVTLPEDEFAEVAAYFGISTAELSQRLSITVSILRDMSVTATVRHQTEELDYAILELSRPIYDRTFLPIRESSEVNATENCFALGFPAIQNLLQDVNSYTFDDVAVSAGKVNKIVGIDSVDYVQTSASTSGGSSGGPLVDEDGNVIGICNAGLDANNFFAIASSQLTPALKSLGIEYTPADGSPLPEPEPTDDGSDETPAPVDKSALNTAIANAKALDTANYTEESLNAFDEALAAAEEMAADSNATQEQVDAAATALKNATLGLEESSSGFPMWAIIVIAAAVAAAIIIAIILIAASNKKKNAVPAAAARPAGPVPPVTPAAGGFTPPAAAPAYQKNGPGTTVLNSGAGETTVLSAGGSETTVLSQNLGSLTRKKNQETIQITKPNFRIGKERSAVDYCISDNTAVSRVHVILINRGGQMYAADQRSTNGTFVNNVRVDSGKEVRLNSGDKLTLGDEEFVFNS